LAERRFVILLVYAFLALPWLALGALHSMESHANSPIDWVTDAFAPRRVYDEFRAAFGQGDTVIASWPGCTVGNPQLRDICGALRTSPVFEDSQHRSFFESVMSGSELVQQLAAPPLSLSDDAARRRLLGTLVGSDQQTTCLIVTFTPEGVLQREAIVEQIHQVIEHFSGVAREAHHFAGPIMDGLAVDIASHKTLSELGLPSSLVVFGLCYLALRSVRAALLVFGVSTYAQIVTLALLDYCGRELSALLIVLPPLIQVMAVAGGIHLMNYYIDAYELADVSDPAAHALQLGWLPCTLSAGTTAIGLGSLLVSQLTPIRDFGAFAAIGILVTSALALLFIPGTLTLWRWDPRSVRSVARLQFEVTFWDRWAGMVGRHYRSILVGSLLLAVLLTAGLNKIRTSVRMETMFAGTSRILQDYDWLEEHLGPLIPVEILVRCDVDAELSTREQLAIVQDVQQRLWDMPTPATSVSPSVLAGWWPSAAASAAESAPSIDSSHTAPAGENDAVGPQRHGISQSALTFLPAIERPAIAADTPEELRNGIESEFQRRWDEAIEGLRPIWQSLGYFHEDEDRRTDTWRVTTYVDSRYDIDYGRYMSDIEQYLRPVVSDSDGKSVAGVTLNVTGVMPLVHGIQRQLMEDLFTSFLFAFVLIAALMIALQGGVIAGLVSMVSNVFPTLVLFGAMGWIREPMDIGSVMTASVALGIAVDDTLHFLTFFRRGWEVTGDRLSALRFAYHHCGRAMVQTSVILALGMAVFGLSEFLPTSRFAWMLVASLITALLADLILLPALLCSVLGKYFETPRQAAGDVDTALSPARSSAYV
jgi:predicted RND superfamily exporter protein